MNTQGMPPPFPPPNQGGWASRHAQRDPYPAPAGPSDGSNTALNGSDYFGGSLQQQHAGGQYDVQPQHDAYNTPTSITDTTAPSAGYPPSNVGSGMNSRTGQMSGSSMGEQNFQGEQQMALPSNWAIRQTSTESSHQSLQTTALPAFTSESFSQQTYSTASQYPETHAITSMSMQHPYTRYPTTSDAPPSTLDDSTLNSHWPPGYQNQQSELPAISRGNALDDVEQQLAYPTPNQHKLYQ